MMRPSLLLVLMAAAACCEAKYLQEPLGCAELEALPMDKVNETYPGWFNVHSSPPINKQDGRVNCSSPTPTLMILTNNGTIENRDPMYCTGSRWVAYRMSSSDKRMDEFPDTTQVLCVGSEKTTSQSEQPKECTPPPKISKKDLKKDYPGAACITPEVKYGTASCPPGAPKKLYKTGRGVQETLKLKCDGKGKWRATDSITRYVVETTNACCVST